MNMTNMTKTQRNLFSTIARYADSCGVASTILVARSMGKTVAQVERIAITAERRGANFQIWISEITGEPSIKVLA